MRTADYDRIASGYDRRYLRHEYAGVREALLNFVGADVAGAAALEVGCGTGHWLAELCARVDADPTGESRPRAGGVIAGVEPSTGMIARARAAVPRALLVRAAAEALPWRDQTFDRIYCVNALHHFADRVRFFTEARRILKPGGGLLSIGKDPHTERDAWWVYDYFPETLEIDRARFARVRTLRGELAAAGFAWAESFECDEIVASMPLDEAIAAGVVDPAYTSQLAVLSEDEFAAGVARLRAADATAGGGLQLTTDFFLFATVGWAG